MWISQERPIRGNFQPEDLQEMQPRSMPSGSMFYSFWPMTHKKS